MSHVPMASPSREGPAPHGAHCAAQRALPAAPRKEREQCGADPRKNPDCCSERALESIDTTRVRELNPRGGVCSRVIVSRALGETDPLRAQAPRAPLEQVRRPRAQENQHTAALPASYLWPEAVPAVSAWACLLTGPLCHEPTTFDYPSSFALKASSPTLPAEAVTRTQEGYCGMRLNTDGLATTV